MIRSRLLKTNLIPKRYYSSSSSSSPFKTSLLILLLAGSTSYAAGTWYAANDSQFNEAYWSKYVPLGASAVELVKKGDAKEIVLKTGKSLDNVKNSIESGELVKDINETVENVKSGVFKGIDTLEKIGKSVSETFDSVKGYVEEAVETGKKSVDAVTSTAESLWETVSGNKSEPKPQKVEVKKETKPQVEVKKQEIAVEEKVKPEVKEKKAKSDKTQVEIIPDSILDEHKKKLVIVNDTLKSLSESSIVGEKLLKSVAMLSASLGTVLEVVKDKKVVDDVVNTLVGISQLLGSLHVEEANLVARALEEQSNKFAETIQKQIQDHQRELASQWQELSSKTESLLENERQLLTAKHEAVLVELLADQSNQLSTQLQAELQKQAQALEKYWENQVKIRIDQEREGRLARLDHLALKLKYLEKINMEAGAAAERSQQIHSIRVVLGSLRNLLSEPHAVSFQKEFKILKKLAENHPYPLISQVLKTIPEETSQWGVVSLPDLHANFHHLRENVHKTQFMPVNGGGPISYSFSLLLSNFMFQKKGNVPGNDVEAVLARTEFYLSQGKVDEAARTLNQLDGIGKVLAEDWMGMARRYLEVGQAIQVIETHLEFMDANVL